MKSWHNLTGIMKSCCQLTGKVRAGHDPLEPLEANLPSADMLMPVQVATGRSLNTEEPTNKRQCTELAILVVNNGSD